MEKSTHEVTSSPGWIADLKLIGRQLDEYVFPAVADSGLVVPNESPVPPNFMGTRNDCERQDTNGSATGSWKGPAGGQRQTCGAPGSAPQLTCGSLRAQYQAETPQVVSAYPGTQAWKRPEGLCFRIPCELLSGLGRRDVLILALRLDCAYPLVRGWAFWDGSTWIGPRHTNYPDGSICAFKNAKRVWRPGEPLIQLIDIYAVWMLRHLHLEVFGRWAGPQSVDSAYERLSELHPDELCGCNKEDGRRYGDCCRPGDVAGKAAAAFGTFFARTGGVRRGPPNAVSRLAARRSSPNVEEMIPV